jgi:hypothetical protein
MKTFGQHFYSNRFEDYSHSPWRPDWLPSVDVTVKHQIPILKPVQLNNLPTYATSFIRSDDCENHDQSLMHGYVDDHRLRSMTNNPAKYLVKFASHLAVVTPDYSIKLGMPIHDRIRSVFMSRAVGAYFQNHALNVIPNIRWAEVKDLEFVLEGLPCNSVIALSSQGIMGDSYLTEIFETGLSSVLKALNPSQIIYYGKETKNLRRLCLEYQLEIIPTDISRVHRKVGC